MDLITRLFAVAAVLALAALAMWILKRNGLVRGVGGNVTRRVEMIERIALSPQVSLHVLRIRDREFTLAVTGAGVTVVDIHEGKRQEIEKGAIGC